MKKISVIIAAYNAEEYLSETLDSIFLQTMNDSEYEVIIINDGSSDSTLDILNSYKQTYSNLIIIDKENGGPSSARNAGLDIAKGEYVFFFDADAVVLYRNDDFISLYAGLYKQMQGNIFTGVFHGIVEQVEDYVGKVHFVDFYQSVFGFQFGINGIARLSI